MWNLNFFIMNNYLNHYGLSKNYTWYEAKIYVDQDIGSKLVNLRRKNWPAKNFYYFKPKMVQVTSNFGQNMVNFFDRVIFYSFWFKVLIKLKPSVILTLVVTGLTTCKCKEKWFNKWKKKMCMINAN